MLYKEYKKITHNIFIFRKHVVINKIGSALYVIKKYNSNRRQCYYGRYYGYKEGDSLIIYSSGFLNNSTSQEYSIMCRIKRIATALNSINVYIHNYTRVLKEDQIYNITSRMNERKYTGIVKKKFLFDVNTREEISRVCK